MKKLFVLLFVSAVSHLLSAQSCCPQTCDKQTCCPKSCSLDGATKEEASTISTLCTNLQAVIQKMSESSVGFDKQVAGMMVSVGSSEDESLHFISKAASTVRYEMLSKMESEKLVASLKEYTPSKTKQQRVSSLKKEIQLLVRQAENL